ncbi:acyl-CoA dehydrogenase [Comamonas endophytica]|uniref:Acyl-CoA dehydrogenase n=1 Tax=Comamonas endophytica TaxID=2949090 RepID=A0ABY6GGJ5_9BURK|nr:MULTISPECIES: acyl-CoA dehydrogenase [unclassified Acidovorax]MCD2513428.1 acyl-CoA dehydrogenase [Acidovorax sp. D4N7]UYG53790.1 acyl-CoA dehydrogenase [Acidovorax sp. 5MLIR]
MSRASAELFRLALQSSPRLPRPGGGATLERWRALAALAAQDLAACKLAEAHWDALVILEDLGIEAPRDARSWGVWAAENPRAPLSLQRAGDGDVLVGCKSWCSGADVVSHALLTCEDAERGPCFVLLDMRAPGISLDRQGWQALGMRHVHTPQLRFDHTPVRLLGERSEYLQRPGFWHGGAGIAACWYGAACEIAQLLRTRLHEDQPHAAAHLGTMFTQLRAARSMFHQLAQRLDAQPHEPWVEEVQALRSFVRRVASDTIERSARAMGPAPLCNDAAHAQRCADLAVWCTQQHAEKDDAELARLTQAPSVVWEL